MTGQSWMTLQAIRTLRVRLGNQAEQCKASGFDSRLSDSPSPEEEA